MEFAETGKALVAQGENLFAVGEFVDQMFDLGVLFKKFYGKIARREMLPDVRVEFKAVLDFCEGVLDVGPEVYMDMPYRRVGAFIDAYHCIQELVDSFARPCRGRHDRHSDHLSEGFIVEFFAGTLDFVIHIEGNDHAAVHVDQLGCKVEISFKV